jgi:hypothetical protein
MAQTPLDPRGGTSPMVSTRLVTEDAQRLDQLAQRRGLTRSATMRELIRAALAAQQGTGPPERAPAA